MATRAAAIPCHVLPPTLMYSIAAAKMIPSGLKKETQRRKGQIEEMKNGERALVMLLTGKKCYREALVLLLCLQEKERGDKKRK